MDRRFYLMWSPVIIEIDPVAPKSAQRKKKGAFFINPKIGVFGVFGKSRRRLKPI